jgi:hypothetical protein
MCTDGQPNISLAIRAVRKRGQQMTQVSAYFGELLLHSDSFAADSDHSRNRFLRRLTEKAAPHGVEVSTDALEGELLQAAENMMMGPGPGGSGCNEEPDPAEVLSAFGLTVLGETKEQGILVWSRYTRKQSVIKSPSSWRAEEVLQCVGSEAAHRLIDVSDGSGDDGYTLEELRRALALAGAQAPRISSAEVIGQGVWRHGERLLIVDGADARFYDGDRFTQPRWPVIGHKILDLDAEKRWHGAISHSVRHMDAEGSRRILQRLRDLFGRWNWTHPWDARVLAGLVPATLIQSLWGWRPWVAITGASDSGKSTLFECAVRPVMLPWTILADRSTEAGLRQAIGHHAAPLLIDEFDQYQHRQRVLELFRTSSRGGKVLRGTADQAGLQFSLKHIPWFAAIESGDTWVQDTNRFIHLELAQPEVRNLVLPGQSELEDLGRELAAAAIWAALSAVPLANSIKVTTIEGVPGRLIESFSVPAAMFAALWYGREATEAQATAVLRRMICGRQNLEVQREPEHERLLRDILAANMRVQRESMYAGVSQELSVGQLLTEYSTYAAGLEAKGLRVYTPQSNGERMLFIDHDAVRRHLLRSTRWQDARIDQILMRAPGALRTQQRCHGTRCRGVAIPLSNCLAEPHIRDSSVTA